MTEKAQVTLTGATRVECGFCGLDQHFPAGPLGSVRTEALAVAAAHTKGRCLTTPPGEES